LRSLQLIIHFISFLVSLQYTLIFRKKQNILIEKAIKWKEK